MFFRGLVMKFACDSDDKLMELVKKRGYSKPTKEDPIARRTLDEMVESGEDKPPRIEVHRTNETVVMVTIFPEDVGDGYIAMLVLEALKDLETCNLVEGPYNGTEIT